MGKEFPCLNPPLSNANAADITYIHIRHYWPDHDYTFNQSPTFITILFQFLHKPYTFLEAESLYTYLFLKHALTAKNLITVWQEMTYYIVILTGYNLYYPIYAISVVVTSIEGLQLQLCMHAFLMWTHHFWLDHFHIWWWVEIMKIITTEYSQFLGTFAKQLWNIAIRFITSVCLHWMTQLSLDRFSRTFIHSFYSLSYNRSTDSSKVSYIGIFTKTCQLQSRLVKTKKKVTLYWNNYIHLHLANTGTGKPVKPKKLVMI